MNKNTTQYARSAQNPAWIAIGAGMALVGISLSGLAAGQEANWTVNPGLQKRWTLEIGAYAPTLKTTANYDSTTLGVGTSVNFEDDLGLDDRKVNATILGRVRLGERWRIEIEYFALHRSGARAISSTVNWGGSTYPSGTVVSSEFDSDIYRLSGGYSFIKDAQAELGVTLGFHVTDFVGSLAATGIGPTTADVLAPLPTIGGRTRSRLGGSYRGALISSR